jgi:hypothetical protein
MLFVNFYTLALVLRNMLWRNWIYIYLMKGGAISMKKLSLVILGSAISFALVTGVFAQISTDSTKTTTTTTKTPKVTKSQAVGTVTAVDAAANTITIKTKKGSSLTFTAGSKVKLADIAKDSKVTVTFTKDSTATSVKPYVTKKKTTTTNTTSTDSTKM